MKKLLCIILASFMLFSFCSCGDKPQDSMQEQLEKEAESDTVEITMPRYLISEDEYTYWSETAQNPPEDSQFLDIKVDEEKIVLTISKDVYAKSFDVEGYTPQVLSLLKEFSSFKSLTISNDFSTATIYVNESLYYSNNDYGIVKTAYESLCERNAYSGVFEPTITINLYAEGTNTLLYTFTHTRPAERIIDITAKELVTAFVSNEESALNEYGNKYVAATGTVQTVELDRNGLPGYVLVKPHSGDSICWLQCNLNESANERATQLQKGDEVTILGLCTERSLHLQIEDCVIF